MVRCLSLFPVLFLSAAISAQTQLVRGKVEDAATQFHLAGTNIRLISTVLDLNTVVGTPGDMQVVDVSTPNNPTLDVRSFAATQPLFEMGNLRLNQSARWQFTDQPGTHGFVFFTDLASTGYFPGGAPGTWVLRPDRMFFLLDGVANGAGIFQFQFTMPNAPQLVGLDVTSQAVLLRTTNEVLLSHPDTKTIQR